MQLDVSSENQILAATLYAVEHLPDGAPGLWAVVHAASWVALGEIEWIPPQVIRKATDINLLGPTRVTQIMLPLVRRAKGRIIYVTSGLSAISSPVRGVHCSLLSAVEAQAQCLRKELRQRGVDVVVVAPGEYTSGAAWLNDGHILEQAKEMWGQLCQEQRDEYGEDYFETAVRSFEKYTKTKVIRKTTDINLLGPTRVTQIMLPLVRRAKGRIIYVTSGLSAISSPVRGVHCSLLSAVEAQAQCLRKELRQRGVDVVVVAPGEYTSGAAWLNDGHILEQAKEMWGQLCQEQRDEYGEDYFETAVRSLEKYTKTQDDISQVLRALNDSVVRTFPLAKYTPVSKQEKLQAFVAHHLPSSVYDIIYS